MCKVPDNLDGCTCTPPNTFIGVRQTLIRTRNKNCPLHGDKTRKED